MPTTAIHYSKRVLAVEMLLEKRRVKRLTRRLFAEQVGRSVEARVGGWTNFSGQRGASA